MKVVAVVQARMSSQRLPGKVLSGLGPHAVIDWVLGRTQRAASVDEVVLATSIDPSDDPLADHCAGGGYLVVRGPLRDVLDRVAEAAATRAADHVVRITGDCPLVDPAVVDEVVRTHLTERRDFTANRLPPPHRRTWPIGLDVEVATAAALARARMDSERPHEREHVMPHLYETPGRFDVRVVECPVDAGEVRWTIDTPADLSAVRELVTVAGADLDTPWQRLLSVWRAHPHLADLNGTVEQRGARDVDQRT